MVTPYITLHGNCKEALIFYQKAFRTEIKSMQQYGDYIPADMESPPKDLCDWVLHAEMEICGTNFWFADETEAAKQGNMVKLTAAVPNAETAQHYFNMLKENGEVSLPPTETFYSTCHCAVMDKYGICWNIVALEAPKQQL